MDKQVHFVDGRWTAGRGAAFDSTDPATAQVIWSGHEAAPSQVDQAVAAARLASQRWIDTPLTRRIEYLRAFAGQLTDHRRQLAQTISLETGKPRWESLTEVAAMIAKIDASIEAFEQRCHAAIRNLSAATGLTRFKPHGVVAVLGPFNFPGHVPNGHIVPALLAGNTVVFKPSEKTPLVAQQTVELWQAAQLPSGVLNLLQGGRCTGAALSEHHDLDGLYFTGGGDPGQALQRLFADRPGAILALEMGGNNPLVVHDVANVSAAAYTTIQSAYLTAGQRCTCARRLIVPAGPAGDAFIEQLVHTIKTIRVGPYTLDPEPFMGPLIDDTAALQVLTAQQDLIDRGGRALIECRPIESCDAMLSPGLIDVTSIESRRDEETFGPLLQIVRVEDFDHAIEEANNTAYGLVAALLCDRRSLYQQFFQKVRAGLINWNRPTTGASGYLPFGGIGKSGNHRPAGYFAADYCAYPVASLESDKLALPEQPVPGIDVVAVNNP